VKLCPRSHNAVVCAVKFVNSFARRYFSHRGKTDRCRFEFSHVSCFLVPVPFRPNYYSFNLFMAVIISNSCEFHRNPFNIIAKRNKYIWHGTDIRRTRESIIPPVQHRLRRHKNRHGSATSETNNNFSMPSISSF